MPDFIVLDRAKQQFSQQHGLEYGNICFGMYGAQRANGRTRIGRQDECERFTHDEDESEDESDIQLLSLSFDKCSHSTTFEKSLVNPPANVQSSTMGSFVCAMLGKSKKSDPIQPSNLKINQSKVAKITYGDEIIVRSGYTGKGYRYDIQ